MHNKINLRKRVFFIEKYKSVNDFSLKVHKFKHRNKTYKFLGNLTAQLKISVGGYFKIIELCDI